MNTTVSSFLCITFVKCIQGLEDPPPEGGQGVLDTGAQAQDALEVGLPQHLLPVGNEVRRAAQQCRHVVHKLRHQAGVGVVRLAVVVRHHLGATEGRGQETAGSMKLASKEFISSFSMYQNIVMRQYKVTKVYSILGHYLTPVPWRCPGRKKIKEEFWKKLKEF